MIRIFLFVLVLCNVTHLLSQVTIVDKKLKYYQNKKLDLTHKNVSANVFPSAFKSDLGLNQDDRLIFTQKVNSKSGLIHFKYKQTYKNLKVIGSNYTLHTKNNQAIKSTGTLLPFINIDTKPKLAYNIVIANLKHQVEGSMERLGYILNLASTTVNFDNLGTVVIDQEYPEFSGNYRLAYHVLMLGESEGLPIKEDIYVDAHSGKLINHVSRVHYHNVPGVVRTKYYGVKDVTIDSIDSNTYLLQDLTRGEGVFTLDENLDVYENDSSFWDLENEKQDEVAADLHYCSSSFYDMMLDKCNWDGIDNQGGQIIGSTHVGGKFLVNAYWDGVRARFGNGDCDRYTPLTTLDIVGHEFAHGITDYTSDLIYRAESGALNEAMSDIFGKALEYYYDRESFNWLLGDRIRRHGNVNVIRSMEDPGVRNDPKFYKGINWYSGSGDNYGVHTNSGVLNYWFYLIVNGGTVKNEIDKVYMIEPIGMDDAFQIAFNMQLAYLTENSKYSDAVIASIESVKDLFGENSLQEEMIERAWNAVGLYVSDASQRVEIVLTSEFVTACPGDIIYPRFNLVNIGQEPLLEGTQYLFDFKSNNAEEHFSQLVELTVNIEPGDSVSMVLTKAFVNEIENNGPFNLSVALYENPDVVLHEVEGEFRTSETDGLDIVLEDVEIFKSEECAQGQPDAFRYRIRNAGCQTVFEGDTLLFEVSTSEGDFLVNIRLYFDFEPGDITNSSRTLRYVSQDLVPDDIEDFEVKLVHVGDINTDNNLFKGQVDNKDFIVNGYRQSFTDVTHDPYYEIVTNTFYNNDTIVNFRNNDMLAIYGLRDHTFLRNCELDEDFFNEYLFKTNIEFCVNGADLEEPIFEFNVMTYNYETREADLINGDHATMVQVLFENGESDLIYGQPEGALINYKIDLPKNYVGELLISALTLSQQELFETNEIFESTDLVLFDDFKLYDKVSLQDVMSYGEYSINPNPVDNILRISHFERDKIFDVHIYNAVGQRLFYKNEIISQDWVDVSTYPEGCYLISIFENGEHQTTVRFVKIDN